MRRALCFSPGVGHRALAGLLGDRRKLVYRDPERAFRVEGLFELSLMQEPPRSDHASEGACVVAGGRFGTLQTTPRMRLAA